MLRRRPSTCSSGAAATAATAAAGSRSAASPVDGQVIGAHDHLDRLAHAEQPQVVAVQVQDDAVGLDQAVPAGLGAAPGSARSAASRRSRAVVVEPAHDGHLGMEGQCRSAGRPRQLHEPHAVSHRRRSAEINPETKDVRRQSTGMCSTPAVAVVATRAGAPPGERRRPACSSRASPDFGSSTTSSATSRKARDRGDHLAAPPPAGGRSRPVRSARSSVSSVSRSRRSPNTTVSVPSRSLASRTRLLDERVGQRRGPSVRTRGSRSARSPAGPRPPRPSRRTAGRARSPAARRPARSAGAGRRAGARPGPGSP